MSEVMLKLKCYTDNKEHFIKWIDNYLSMSAEDKLDEEIVIRARRLCAELGEEEKPTLLQRIKGWFCSNKPNKELAKKLEWEEAFMWFKEVEEQMIGDVHEKMGLPRNGIRPDNC